MMMKDCALCRHYLSHLDTKKETSKIPVFFWAAMMRETGKKKEKENWRGRLFTKHKQKIRPGGVYLLVQVVGIDLFGSILFYDDYLFSEDARARSFAKHYLLFFSYSSMFHIG